MSLGTVVGSKRSITCPSRPIRNLVKFHLIDVVPSRPGFSFFIHCQSASASSPFTLSFDVSGKVTSNVVLQNCTMEASVPGSCEPN
jgi:hypothetical protein